jgi:hypothetical protein
LVLSIGDSVAVVSVIARQILDEAVGVDACSGGSNAEC